MQQSVLFGMLLTIINKGKVTRKQLAEKFEISLRTVSRYLSTLEAANIPIYSTLGRDGGISIAEDYCLEKGFLTSDEHARLVSCLQATVPTFDDNLNQILIQKLQDTAKRNSDSRYLIRADTLYIDASSWHNPQFYREKLAVINKAISTCHTLSITYRDRYNNPSDRLVDPYSLVLKEGIWFVYGWCHTRLDYRIFRLSRIENMITTEQSYQLKEDANVSHKLQENFENIRKINLQIEFSNLRLNDIKEWLGEDSISINSLKYTASASVSADSQLVAKLMSFGSDVKILSPSSLREELTTECQRMINYNQM